MKSEIKQEVELAGARSFRKGGADKDQEVEWNHLTNGKQVSESKMAAEADAGVTDDDDGDASLSERRIVRRRSFRKIWFRSTAKTDLNLIYLNLNIFKNTHRPVLRPLQNLKHNNFNQLLDLHPVVYLGPQRQSWAQVGRQLNQYLQKRERRETVRSMVYGAYDPLASWNWRSAYCNSPGY